MTCESWVTPHPPQHATITDIEEMATTRATTIEHSTTTPLPWVSSDPTNQGMGAMGRQRPDG